MATEGHLRIAILFCEADPGPTGGVAVACMVSVSPHPTSGFSGLFEKIASNFLRFQDHYRENFMKALPFV